MTLPAWPFALGLGLVAVATAIAWVVRIARGHPPGCDCEDCRDSNDEREPW